MFSLFVCIIAILNLIINTRGNSSMKTVMVNVFIGVFDQFTRLQENFRVYRSSYK